MKNALEYLLKLKIIYQDKYTKDFSIGWNGDTDIEKKIINKLKKFKTK